MKLGLLDVLFVVFLVLRLIGAIAWSWWIIFSPLIVQVILIFILVELFDY